jgi:pimeloyl-ACP methyl ester carboxylesterase
MADDAMGVLDALGIARAHVVGASMGGMIAQRLAASAPQRMASLVSIMSSSGARHLPGPRPDVAAALMRRPAGRTEAALVAHSLGLVRLISSPAYPQDEGELADRITRALRRAYRPDGVVRQMLAIGADSGRAALLPRIASPSLVLHGDADPLVPMACGEDTARRIPGARFVPVPGMGHDLPPRVIEILLHHMVPFLQTAEKHR